MLEQSQLHPSRDAHRLTYRGGRRFVRALHGAPKEEGGLLRGLIRKHVIKFRFFLDPEFYSRNILKLLFANATTLVGFLNIKPVVKFIGPAKRPTGDGLLLLF